MSKISATLRRSVSEIRDNLRFHNTFPQPDKVRECVLHRVPRKTGITEKAVLRVLRHDFTNYDELLYSRQWDHDELKAEVNRLILERIGSEWQKQEANK